MPAGTRGTRAERALSLAFELRAERRVELLAARRLDAHVLVHVEVEQQDRGVELLLVDRARTVLVDRRERLVDRGLEHAPAVHAQRDAAEQQRERAGEAEGEPRARRERELARGRVHRRGLCPIGDKARQGAHTTRI